METKDKIEDNIFVIEVSRLRKIFIECVDSELRTKLLLDIPLSCNYTVNKHFRPLCLGYYYTSKKPLIFHFDLEGYKPNCKVLMSGKFHEQLKTLKLSKDIMTSNLILYDIKSNGKHIWRLRCNEQKK